MIRPTDEILYLIIIATLVLLAVALFFTATVLTVHIRRERREARHAALDDAWEPLLLDALASGAHTFPADRVVQPADRMQFVWFLVRYARRLRGAEREVLEALAAPYLPEIALRSRHRSPELRARALQTLTTLGMPAHADHVLRALDDPSPLVAMTAARGLAHRRHSQYAPDVLARVGRFGEWNHRFLSSMLSGMGEAAVPTLRSILAQPDASAHSRSVAAHALAQLRDLESAGIVVTILTHDTDGELLAACLALLAVVGHGHGSRVHCPRSTFRGVPMTGAAVTVLSVISILVIVYFLLLNLAYLATSLLAFFALRRYERRLKAVDVEELISMAGAPPITMIAPAYNEEATCVDAIQALLTLRYPHCDVIVVNDGSRDRTVEVMREAYDMEPAARLPTADLATQAVRAIYRSRRYENLWLIDKENGGKADALNTGLNFCRTPVFCAMDADTLLEPDALIRIVRPFFEDRTTVAAGGIIRIVNGSTVRLGRVDREGLPGNLLARIQVLEYVRAFLAGRMGWSAIRAMLIISGAFGLFRRETVVAAGGFLTTTVGEDMELVVRLHRYCRDNDIPYNITFVPDPVAWTECPESLSVLGRQRDRWQRGLAQVLLRHRGMLLNPRYGRIGLVAFPYFFFLEMIGPLIELLGYISFILLLVLGYVDPLYMVTFIMVAVVLGVAISVASIGMEELTFGRSRSTRDLLRLLLLSLLENVGYRQLSTYWRVKGLLSVRRMTWGAMARRGFTRTPPPA